MLLAVLVAERIYQRHLTDLVITSGSDGTHGEKSKHYAGNAVDLRTKTLPGKEIERAVASELQEALGREYLVILETDHIHVQYEPKRTEQQP
jgi:hypothetical protein